MQLIPVATKIAILQPNIGVGQGLIPSSAPMAGGVELPHGCARVELPHGLARVELPMVGLLHPGPSSSWPGGGGGAPAWLGRGRAPPLR